MAEAARYEFGAEVACSDAAGGTLKRLVIDPAARSLTHLVVEPAHRVGMARLVPLDLAQPAGASIRLSCTAGEFEHLDPAEQAPVLPADMNFGYQEVGSLDGFGGNSAPPVFIDNVPDGEVELGADRVSATDGHVGHMRGLVVGPAGRLTHVLIQEGHWRHKDLTIAIADVADLSAGVQLRLNRREVQDLVRTA